MQFQELNLSQDILSAVEELGFTEMTEIQEKSIPLMLQGRDIVGRSNTGTGKTAAFGLPAVESITEQDRNTVAVLILCPTRELAMQAYEEIRKFAKYKHIVKPCAVYGGASMEKQIFQLKLLVGGVDGDEHRADLLHRKEGEHPFRHVGGPDGHMVPLLHADGHEAPGQDVGVPLELPIGPAPPLQGIDQTVVIGELVCGLVKHVGHGDLPQRDVGGADVGVLDAVCHDV